MLLIFSPFQAIDKDGSGYITVGELRSLGNMDSVKTDALMDKLDRQQKLTRLTLMFESIDSAKKIMYNSQFPVFSGMEMEKLHFLSFVNCSKINNKWQSMFIILYSIPLFIYIFNYSLFANKIFYMNYLDNLTRSKRLLYSYDMTLKLSEWAKLVSHQHFMNNRYHDVQFFSCWHWLCDGWRYLKV